MAVYEERLEEILPFADSAMSEVLLRIDSSPDIPEHAKQMAKDFVIENWTSLLPDEIIDAIPDEISEYLPVIKGIITAVKIFMALRH